jgi:hypothetical protein
MNPYNSICTYKWLLHKSQIELCGGFLVDINIDIEMLRNRKKLVSNLLKYNFGLLRKSPRDLFKSIITGFLALLTFTLHSQIFSFYNLENMSQFQYIFSYIVPALIIMLPSDDNPENRATERLSFADGKF